MKQAPRIHIVEIKAGFDREACKGQFDKLAEDVLRAELAILLQKGKLATSPVIPEIEEGYSTPPFELGEFVVQEKRFIVAEIQKKYQGLTKARIESQLNKLSILAKQNPDAWNAAAYLPKVEIETVAPPEPKRKGRGKKRKERKQGRMRPIEVNGVPYESMAEADRQTGLGRGFIEYHVNQNSL